MGTITPKITGAVSNTVTLWKRLSLYGLVDFKRGNKLLNTDETIRCSIFVVCDVNVHPEKYDPKFVANAQNGSSLQIVDQFIQDASFAMAARDLRELQPPGALRAKSRRDASLDHGGWSQSSPVDEVHRASTPRAEHCREA